MRCKECGVCGINVQNTITRNTRTCGNCRKALEKTNSNGSNLLIKQSEIYDIIEILKILLEGKLIALHLLKKSIITSSFKITKYLNYCKEKQFVTIELTDDTNQTYYYIISDKGRAFLESVEK